MLSHFLEQHLLTCSMKGWLGVDCPGCGMQRAFLALLNGDIYESLRLNSSLIPFLITFFYTLAHLIFGFKGGARLLVIFFSCTTLIMFIQFVIKLMWRT